MPNGAPIVIGQGNDGTQQTTLSGGGSAAFYVHNGDAAASGVQGASESGIGVYGISGTGSGITTAKPAGVRGDSTAVMGVVGTSAADAGVYGEGSPGVRAKSFQIGVQARGSYRGVEATSSVAGTGVWGQGGTGVSGEALGGGPGVYGVGDGGVSGTGTTVGVAGEGPTGVKGVSTTDGVGVLAQGGNYGVWGESGDVPPFRTGVVGYSKSGVGIWGFTTAGIGVVASAGGGTRLALRAAGNAEIRGALYVTGAKSAVVKAHDGSHRALYCVESPECWFEDFGRARLVRGKTRIRMDRTFAAVVRTGDYHVFLSPEGPSQGLYVSRRTRDGFEVREQHRGTSTVPFSYRIVARRKGVDAPRFKRVKLSALPKLPPRPKVPRPVRPPQLETFLRLKKGRKPSAGKPAHPRPRT